jgi:hypothetical protein
MSQLVNLSDSSATWQKLLFPIGPRVHKGPYRIEFLIAKVAASEDSVDKECVYHCEGAYPSPGQAI